MFIVQQWGLKGRFSLLDNEMIVVVSGEAWQVNLKTTAGDLHKEMTKKRNQEKQEVREVTTT
jgi:hypothetical protein